MAIIGIPPRDPPEDSALTGQPAPSGTAAPAAPVVSGADSPGTIAPIESTPETGPLGSVGPGGYGPNPYKDQLTAWLAKFETQFGSLDASIPGTNLKVKDLRVPLVEESAEFIELPGYGLTSMTALLQEPQTMDEGDVLNLQKNLAAAGYISPSSFDTPGWYDHPTKTAYSYLIQEAIERGMNPKEVLRMRILIRDGKTPEEAERLVFGPPTEDEHIRSLQAAYIRAWKRQPPPGYVEEFKHFNPDELELYERNKEAWEASPVAEREMQEMSGALEVWARQGRGA